jgi:hypothetical protein
LICQGGGTRVETAIKIIEATGSLVRLEDLAGEVEDQGGAPGGSEAASTPNVTDQVTPGGAR